MYMVQDPCLKTEISLNFEDGTYLIDPSSSTLQYNLSIHINKHSLKLLSQIRRQWSCTRWHQKRRKKTDVKSANCAARTVRIELGVLV